MAGDGCSAPDFLTGRPKDSGPRDGLIVQSCAAAQRGLNTLGAVCDRFILWGNEAIRE